LCIKMSAFIQWLPISLLSSTKSPHIFEIFQDQNQGLSVYDMFR